MNAAVLVLFTRSLAMDTRKFLTYLARMALVFIIIFALMTAHVQSSFIGAPGLMFFTGVTVMTLILVTLAGIVFFSSAICEEKEEMTLGLLRMTGLSPLSILMGKGASRVVGGVFLVLVQFPFTLLAITLGGVSLGQVIAAYATIISYMLFLGGVSLFCSVCCRRSGTAAALTFLLTLLFLLGPWLCGLVVTGMQQAGWVSSTGFWSTGFVDFLNWVHRTNPFLRLHEIMQTGFAEPAFGFQVKGNLLLGLVFFLLSWLVFDLFTQQEVTAGPARPVLLRLAAPLKPLRVDRAWHQALIWKEFQFGTSGKPGFLARLLLLPAFCVLVAALGGAFKDRIDWEYLGNALMLTTLGVTYLELFIQAGHTFNCEYKWRTLPNLGLLPISTRRLVWSKIAGCLIPLIPYGVIFLVGVIMSPDDFGRAVVGTFESTGVFAFIMSITYLVCLLALTAYLSLVVKRGGIALALLIFIPGMYLVQGIFGILFFAMAMGGGAEVAQVVFFTVQTAIAVFLTLLFYFRLLRRIELRAGE